MKVVVDATRCKASGECIKVCPEKAISLKDGKAVIDPQRCDHDGICIPACPHHALSLTEE